MLRAFVITLLDFSVKVIFFLCVIGGVFVGGYWRDFVGKIVPGAVSRAQGGAPINAQVDAPAPAADALARESADISGAAQDAFSLMGAAIGGGAGLIIGALACGLAFVLLDIRAQTRRTADLLQKIDNDDQV